MLLAGFLPDLDCAPMSFGHRLYRAYHRVLGHGILTTFFGPALLIALAAPFGVMPSWELWAWLQAACLVHLVVDVCFYRWPVQLFWPFSRKGWGLGWVAWNDLVPTLTLDLGAAGTMLWPGQAPMVAAAGLALQAGYLSLRARRRPSSALARWLAGGWARQAPTIWRWLTGDFVT